MEINEIVNKLDREFNIPKHSEDLVAWAVTDENKKFINPDFLNKKTALFSKNSVKIEKVYTVVFITEEIVNAISDEKDCLIITHHNFNYFEDERGLQPIRSELLEKLESSNNSIYVAHAPLDTHGKYGTSVSLANLCDIDVEEYFYDYFGAPTALIGTIKKQSFKDFSNLAKNRIERPFLTEVQNIEFVERIAVIAGGGDEPEILQYAYDKGCDTILSGTVEHRWAAPFIQESNKKFHELNETLKLNLIGGTHYATERPAMIKFIDFFKEIGVNFEFRDDFSLLNAE
ncbi:MAG: Nif3-like dinuclear metal center hexameric protein [Spirochaetales bacterium]|uniref:Nif3-like dinuclear metal center hexameric protein n=1 Tax=Candidatus Thalassospirochaeta sargassi TaxID=3119039 RepID=A0AAJ1IDR4_9SPIO|nr:Nif3-like dinuclear metal center hexameric protein [Spirochaetales bacterium]